MITWFCPLRHSITPCEIFHNGFLIFASLFNLYLFSSYVCSIKTRTWTFSSIQKLDKHVDVIKWKHFPRYWTFARGIRRSPVNSPYKGRWRGALMFSLIFVWIKGSVNNREVGNLRRHRAHYDVTVMKRSISTRLVWNYFSIIKSLIRQL